nr:alpha-ribazole phosphatase [Roseivirga pacifica]
MEIYLVRHTRPNVRKGICYGQTDLDLADSFMTDRKLVDAKMPVNIDCIYTSPLQRSEKLARSLHENIVVDDRLKELDFGAWEMKPWDDIPKDEIMPWMDDFVNHKVPGGESFIDLKNRCESFITELSKKPYKKVVIVTHAGPIRVFLGTFLEMQPKNFFRLTSGYGGVSRIDVGEQRVEVTYMNR